MTGDWLAQLIPLLLGLCSTAGILGLFCSKNLQFKVQECGSHGRCSRTF